MWTTWSWTLASSSLVSTGSSLSSSVVSESGTHKSELQVSREEQHSEELDWMMLHLPLGQDLNRFSSHWDFTRKTKVADVASTGEKKG